ncbi:Hypothetical protein LUCI_1965 [Lucifera butyrica]|uniref:Uncharacterized protein n=1 Tax=Lucifera butyrica TaxID=1351585 RepID=A0A498R6C0_9FIRM|nr:hypothetical protein [Lucifera butyrica]VBB06729.1 Hypothetical protein LUCI_1965 [Lucifera butyrica]
MSIRPLDMQTILPQATTVSKNQHAAEHQNTLQQQGFAEQLQQIADKRLHQIQNVPKNEQGRVQREKHFKEQHANEQQADDNQENRKYQNHSNEEEDAGKDPSRGSHIDIKA